MDVVDGPVPTPFAPAVAARPARVLHLDARRNRQLRLVAAFVGAVGVTTSAAMLALGGGPEEDATRVVAALLPVLATAIVVTLLVRQIARVRLVVSDGGVAYHGFGASIRARWGDIVAPTPDRRSGRPLSARPHPSPACPPTFHGPSTDSSTASAAQRPSPTTCSGPVADQGATSCV